MLRGIVFAAAVAFAAPAMAAGGSCFADLAATHNYTNGLPVKATPTPDSKAVIYLRSGPRDRIQHLYEFDLATKTEREIVTPEKLLAGATEQLSAEERARRERQRVVAQGFVDFELSRDGKHVLLTLGGKLYVVERPGDAVIPLPGEGWLAPKFSPDGTKVAALRDGELHVIDIAARKDTQLTHGASPTLAHGEAEFVAQEEMDRPDGFWWSPNSQSIAYEEADLSGVEVHYVADPLHPNTEPVAFRYPRAGTANAKVRLGVIGIGGGNTLWIPWDTAKYEYLVRVTWRDGPLTLVVQNRTQTEEQILAADERTGKTRLLWTEKDDAFLELPQPDFPRWIEGRNEFLWASERNGQWVLEARNGSSPGHLMIPSTFRFRFDAVVDVDTTSLKTPVIIAEGAPAFEPSAVAVIDYQVQPYTGERERISQWIWRFAGQTIGDAYSFSEAYVLSREPGIHNARFGDQHRIFADSYNLADGTQGVDVRDRNGKLIATLPSVAEQPPSIPNVEYLTVGDQQFDALVVRPRDFDPKRHYPVLLAEYTGPTSKQVMAAPRQSLERQCYADQGFIVVTLDNRGTPGRDRAWLRTIKGNLIDTALADQVDGLRAIAARVPQMDMKRVGVIGWSFGGYFAAHATMRRPDVFAAGVAGAPVTDWQFYDTYYTERYMGLPSANADGYRKSSVLTYVDQLQRPLLIVHGATDDNVYFQNTMTLIQSLLAAGKTYELLLLPGTHMLADPNIRARESERVIAFFREHLGAPQ